MRIAFIIFALILLFIYKNNNYSYKDIFRKECKKLNNNNYECQEIIKKCYHDYVLENKIIEECYTTCYKNQHLRKDCEKICDSFELYDLNDCVNSYKKTHKRKYFRK